METQLTNVPEGLTIVADDHCMHQEILERLLNQALRP